MFKNYIKTAIRNLLRNKMFTFINLIGLAIGIACTLLILLWIKSELSYEKHHEKSDQIYQAYLKGIQGDDISYQSTTSPAIAGILKEEYPEIIESVRLGNLGDVVVKYNDKVLLESQGMAVDPSLLYIFTYPMLRGNAEVALNDPFSIVLTEDFARKYFGSDDPLGKTLKINNEYSFRVTGVIQNLPLSSYRKFDFLVHFSFLKELGHDIYGRPFYPCAYLTYLLVKENTSAEQLNQKVRNRLLSEGKEIRFEIELVPLNKTYLLDTGGSQKLYAFSFIALAILILACINFTNLATVRSMNRSREIGIRKVVGAFRPQIIRQFLSESIILACLASIFAIIFTEIFLLFYNDYTSRNLTIDYTDPIFILSLVSIILLTGLLSGIYPAMFLSSFRPIHVLKNSLKSGSGKSVLRKTLVAFQFILSIFFIICTIIMSQQTRYIQNFSLGMNIDNTIYVKLDGDIQNKTTLIKNELLKNPDIYSVCSASLLPNAIRSGSFFQWGINDDHPRRMCYTFVDYDYLKTFGIKMADGRFYNKDFPTDQDDAIIVNEAAIRKIGLKSPVNKPFYLGDSYHNLIGVVKDFQHNSPLNVHPEPLALILRPEGNELLFAKINPALQDIHAIGSAVGYIKRVCDGFSKDRPLSYRFLSDYEYERETNVQMRQKLIFYSALLAIIISSLGLFGVSSFMIKLRTKEIGIRKVIGSSILSIISLLSKEYILRVLIAYIIACPLAWYAMNKWLQDFAYRISINILPFLYAGAVAMIIAVLAISWQAVRAATANPVDSLRYE